MYTKKMCVVSTRSVIIWIQKLGILCNRVTSFKDNLIEKKMVVEMNSCDGLVEGGSGKVLACF